MNVRNGQAGMTLIEIVLVLAIVGGLMAFFMGGLATSMKRAKEGETQLAFNQIKSMMQMYRMQNDRFPTTEQGLKALVENPGNAKNWRGPYGEAELLNDAWGNPIQYESDGRKMRLTSAGDDGELGTEDDLSWPQEKEAAH